MGKPHLPLLEKRISSHPAVRVLMCLGLEVLFSY